MNTSRVTLASSSADETYRKVRFHHPEHGDTAGLVVDSEWIERNATGDFVAAVSRLYPRSECLKMGRLYISPEFATWEQAFGYVFPEVKP